MTLKEKTINGLLWSFVDTFAGQGISFIVGIILARILSPREFGLIGMITIFIAISQSFIDSGFSQALIRKKDCSSEDYSTVFYFNLATGILFFAGLFFAAPAISNFFHEPALKSIIQVLGLILIIESVSIIQRTILTKRIDFKLQAQISVIASIISGAIAITLALLNFGVWSLVALQLSKQAINSFFLWLWNNWKPIFVFSTSSFNELFGFGSKLLLSGLIDTTYRNIYYLIIGKYFSAVELGFYTRADQFQTLPSSNLNTIINRVSYPVLASIKDDIPRLKKNYRKLIRSTMFLSFILMLGMAAISKPMIITLIGIKWLPSVIYLQLLCFVGMLYPLHAINLNMLNVQGRSDLFLRLEIIKKILAVPIIFLVVFMGIKAMIIGMFVLSLIAFYLNSYWSGKLIGYSSIQQVKDILPSLFLALIVNATVFSISFFGITSSLILLLIQLVTGGFLTILICEGIKFKDYIYIKNILLEKLIKRKENE